MNAEQRLPGVWHLQDAMGVCMTLLCGEKRALLVDAGYGLENAHAFARTLTDAPVSLLVTHGHHDHALGAMHFSAFAMFEEDLDDLAVYTGRAQRERVMAQARARGIEPPEQFPAAALPRPVKLAEGEMDLGGLTAQIIHCPGHTPGSAVVYVPQRRLLLTADNWNPCTWLFFPRALGAEAYRANVHKLLELPFEHVLCSHQPHLYPRKAFADFLRGLTDECLRLAKKVDMGHPADTREAAPAEGQIFVFDWNKTGLSQKEM